MWMDSSLYITLLKVKLFKGVVSRLACSQALYFLLKVHRARVIKIKTAGN